MQTPSYLPNSSIADIFFQTWSYGTISRMHRQQLCFLILGDSLSEEEYTAIDRLLHAVRRGWLKIVD